MTKKTTTPSTFDPTKIVLSILSTTSMLNPAGGTAHLYSNGTMTANFWLGWSYIPASGDTTQAPDVTDYLTTPGNLTWGFVESASTAGDPLSTAGWTVSTVDNGYDHDTESYSSLQKPASTSAALTGAIAFYILPAFSEAGSRNIYCCINSTLDNQTTLEQPLPATVECTLWPFQASDFIFNSITQNDSNLVLKQLCYTPNYVQRTPSYRLIKWVDFHPRENDLDDTNQQSNAPFDAGTNGQLFAQLYCANDADDKYGRMVYLLQGNENLGQNLTSLSSEYTTNESYHFKESSSLYMTDRLYANTSNHNWDASSLTGVLIGSHGGRALYWRDGDGNGQNVSVNNYSGLVSGGYHYVDLDAVDNFGTQMKFRVHLEGDNCITWNIDSVAIIKP